MPRDKHLVPVRLSEVPATVRCAAAQREARYVPESERLELLAAAVAPSDRVYWVSREAAARARVAA